MNDTRVKRTSQLVTVTTSQAFLRPAPACTRYTGECSDSWPKEHPIVMSAEQMSAHGTLTYASHGFKKSCQVTVASNERCYHEGLMKSRSMRTTSRSMRIASSLRTLQLLHLREVKVTGFEHRAYLYCTKLRQSKPSERKGVQCT